ncbi:Hypothetical protein FKW44_019109, partial [Caligus rogercresseyi]
QFGMSCSQIYNTFNENSVSSQRFVDIASEEVKYSPSSSQSHLKILCRILKKLK